MSRSSLGYMGDIEILYIRGGGASQHDLIELNVKEEGVGAAAAAEGKKNQPSSV